MFEQQLVLVTGASRGIGSACLTAFAEMGATVIGTATSQSGADKITEHLSELGVNGIGLVLDQADIKSVDALFAEIQNRFEKLPTILVNNAGITKDNLALRMSDEDWLDVVNTNLSGAFLIAKRCVKSMVKARYGRIINIASVSGIMGNPGQTNYSASKAGLIGWSKSLAKELASRGVTVNVVAPGFVETDMTAHFNENMVSELVKSIPVGRFAKADEIAAVVQLLASDAGAYITGETININGGLHMV